MAAVNNDPIFTRAADIQWNATSPILTSAMTAANVSGYNGTDANVALIFTADATNGGFVRSIRAKCCAITGTSAASVLRIFLNNGSANSTAANNSLIGEVTLPATAYSIAAASPDIEDFLNIPIPAGYKLYAGLGTAVTTGWSITVFAGKY